MEMNLAPVNARLNNGGMRLLTLTPYTVQDRVDFFAALEGAQALLRIGARHGVDPILVTTSQQVVDRVVKMGRKLLEHTGVSDTERRMIEREIDELLAYDPQP